jgi:hypothetical protein
VAAISAFTRVFNALWRRSKGDGNKSALPTCPLNIPKSDKPISVGRASFEARFRSRVTMADHAQKTAAVDRYFGGAS